jgi:alanyl-tRNA synthetase
MTRKLYWETPYEKEFDATIVEVRKEGVILDQTLFYPKSGGQANDRGLLKAGNLKVEINDISQDGEEIVHHLAPNFINQLKIGQKIRGEIDWEYRYGLMKAHTSQHLLSALILKKHNIATNQVYIEFEDVTLNLAKTISYEILKSALSEINKVFTIKNYEITGKTLPFEEAKKLAEKIRGDLPEHDNIRLIQAENYDLVCCGGTHVHNSTEIGPIFLYSFKKGKEIKYYVGKMAIETLSSLNVDLLDSADLLRQSITELKTAIKEQAKLVSELKKENNDLLIDNLKMISQLPEININDNPVYFLDSDIDNKILSKQFKNFPRNSILILSTKKNRVKILSKSKIILANEIIQRLIKKYGGKGGGSSQSAQCLLENRPKTLINDLKEYISQR